MVSRNVEYTDYHLMFIGFMDLHLVCGLCSSASLRLRGFAEI